jgi:hypothetical protein
MCLDCNGDSFRPALETFFSLRQYIDPAEGSKVPEWSTWMYSNLVAGNVKIPTGLRCAGNPGVVTEPTVSCLPSAVVAWQNGRLGNPFSSCFIVSISFTISNINRCRGAEIYGRVFLLDVSRTRLWGREWEFSSLKRWIPLHERSYIIESSWIWADVSCVIAAAGVRQQLIIVARYVANIRLELGDVIHVVKLL